MAMDFRDGIAIVECAALAGSWIWLRAKKLSYSGWRRKASLAALGCVSLALFLDLINTTILRLIGIERVVHWVSFGRFGSLSRGLFAAIGTMGCLSLVLGLLGKGSPRILALAWFCFLLIPNASVFPSIGSGLYSQWLDAAPIRNRLAALAGHGAINCGHVMPRTDPEPSSKCVFESFDNHRPFYVLYDTQEFRIDSHFIDALAGDKSGNFYDVEFSSMGWSTEGQSGRTQLLDGGHIFVEPCWKPITLRKSIYKGLTCIPRIMERPSEILSQGNVDPSELDDALGYAACGDDPAAVQKLLAAGARVNVAGESGYTPLMGAINNRRIANAKILIDAGADVNARIPENGDAPLTLPLYYKRDSSEGVSLLLAKGANPNTANSVGRSALMLATFGQPISAVKDLLQAGANVNAQDRNGNTALMAAAEYNNVEAVKLLLKAHADRALRNKDGETALSIATSGNRAEVVQLLTGNTR
jgi:ankyrin repeat protein